ncbi:hypothetical protein [Chitiniphilus eburneus]|uniref:hypothetical protein n=1 Tax=Chitiniphilus eburneus TaxID=2571148 RepID=UPI0035CF6E73
MAATGIPWADALTSGLGALGGMAGGGPSSASQDNNGSLNPIVGDLLVNFGGTQTMDKVTQPPVTTIGGSIPPMVIYVGLGVVALLLFLKLGKGKK